MTPSPTTTGGPGTGGTGGGNGTGDGSAPAGAEQWFLHAEGTCDSPTFYLDRNDTAGDADGCGYIGTGNVWELAARGPSQGGSGVAGTTYLVSDGPSYVEVAHVLLVDGGEVARSEIEGSALTGLGYAAFEYEIQADVPEGSTITLQVEAFGVPTLYLGTEGDHASSFTLG